MAYKKKEPGKKPDMVIRCRQEPDSEFFMTIGVAWEVDLKNGSKGYSVKLQSVPTNWDGSCLMMPPKEEEE